MTEQKFIELYCDYPGCDRTLSYAMLQTIGKTREKARKENWKCKNGNDYCDLHSNK